MLLLGQQYALHPFNCQHCLEPARLGSRCARRSPVVIMLPQTAERGLEAVRHRVEESVNQWRRRHQRRHGTAAFVGAACAFREDPQGELTFMLDGFHRIYARRRPVR